MRICAVALPMLVAISFALLANTSRTSDRKPVADFTLRDHHGRVHSLGDQSDKKLIVVVFLRSGCPLAQAYAPVLAGLADTYGPRGVGFIGINANALDALADIDIPPAARDHREVAEPTFRRNVRLLSLSPHMHLRGKSFRVEAVMSDGRRDILLDVPRYDFHWQLRYELAEPRRLPAGTRLVCTATYDNSAANPANADPHVRVRWGDQTWNEMLIGFIAFVEE